MVLVNHFIKYCVKSITAFIYKNIYIIIKYIPNKELLYSYNIHNLPKSILLKKREFIIKVDFLHFSIYVLQFCCF
jgi:hypothetical protein